MKKFLDEIDNFPIQRFLYDASETVEISSLALLKMLRHGRAGIPVEVMGLMLGNIIDPLTIKVVDVFAMPQTGTGISVEAIDPAFQTKMLDMLEQIKSRDIIVGWYHSHPGFGCWLSGVDINTQQSFEQLNNRSFAVVIDPIQSAKGKIIIEAFRLYPTFLKGQEIREITCIEALVNNQTLQNENHGLNKYYYALNISFMKNLIEEIVFSSIYERTYKLNYSSENFLKLFKKQVLISYSSIIDLLRKTSFDRNLSPVNILKATKEKAQKTFIKLEILLKKIINESIEFCLNEILCENVLS